MTKRQSALELVYSKQQLSTILNSNSLIVGVGGIGCELLKVLTNSGYMKLTIVDLDSIELSNLNRQFYFRREHVGRSKAEVGRESVLKKNQQLDITAIKGSIFENRFDVSFFSQFDIVFCALDNIPAREHLGKMCIRSGRVMVDAGTSGFNGQVNVTIKNYSQCNNCQPSAPVTSYAICTIRSSPSEPIHCVSYGMSLYKILFGPQDKDNDLYGYLQDNIDLTNKEALQNNSIKLFDSLFYDKIKQGLDDDKSFNKFRYPIDYQSASNIDDIYNNQQDQDGLSDNQKIQPVKFYAEQFISSIRDIFQSGQVGNLDFEKDDPICMAFITSVVFFRTYNFTHKFKNVNQQLVSKDKFKYLSQHDVKVMGGKVIPAIASTNAIAAAIQCLEANKVQGNDLKSLQYVWITQNMNRINITNLAEPLQNCKACAQNIIYVNMRGNFTKHKFQDFLHLIKKVGLEQKAISITGSADFIYSQNDPYMKECNDECLNTFLGDIIQDQQSLSFTIAEDETMNQNEYWKFGIYYEFFIANYEGDFIFDNESQEQDILEQRKKYIQKQFLYQQAERKSLYQKYEKY